MSNNDYELCCLVECDNRPFCVRVPPYQTIYGFKRLIQEHNNVLLQGDANQLILRKDNSDFDTYRDDIFAGKYRPVRAEEIIDRPLMRQVSHEWPSPPPSGRLHVFVSVPPAYWSVLLTAKQLHSELWGKDLNSVLEQVPDCSEMYMSQTKVDQLQLYKLGHNGRALLVRGEYITAMDALEGPFQPYEAVVITGQHGIGKSGFLYYALLRRLCSEKCTAFQLPVPDSYILFQESGVTIHATNSQRIDFLPAGSWALSDSSDCSTTPCDAFLMACGKEARVIQASSVTPKRPLFPGWTRKRLAAHYFMNPFFPEEFIALGKVLGLSGDALLRQSKKWGPSARTCFGIELNIEAGADAAHEWNTRIAATTLVHSFHRRGVLDMFDVSRTLLAIRPKGSRRATMTIEVATDHLNQIIAETTAVAWSIERAQFYDAISRDPTFESLAGYIFKIFFCAWFSGRLQSPTLRCSPPLPSSWWSRSGLRVVPVCNEVHKISDMVSLNEVDRSNLPVGWWPVSQSFDTVNAFICTDKLIITIQVTVTSTHRVNLKVLDKMREHFPPPFLAKRRWCHLFVTDKEYKAAQLRTNEYKVLAERNITVHSTVIDISELPVSEEDIRQAGEIMMEDEKDVD